MRDSSPVCASKYSVALNSLPVPWRTLTLFPLIVVASAARHCVNACLMRVGNISSASSRAPSSSPPVSVMTGTGVTFDASHPFVPSYVIVLSPSTV